MSLCWTKPKEELPPYGVPVLCWNYCEKCWKQIPHAHTCVAKSYPNHGPYIGYFCRGMKDDFYADRYPESMLEDHWSPTKPSHWAYIEGPSF